MPYQLPEADLSPEAAVVWGPFPLRRARLAGGLLIVALAAMLGVVGLQRHILACERAGAGGGQCEWQTGLGASSVRRFPLAALRSVRVAYSQTSNKGHVSRWGQLVLNIEGRELMEVIEGGPWHRETLRQYVLQALSALGLPLPLENPAKENPKS